MEGEREEFSPKDIKAYRYTDSKYYISEHIETADGSKQIFIEYLIDGIVDIYYYFDDTGGHYLIDSDGKLLPLEIKEREVYKDYNTYIMESKEYVGLLKYSFSQSPTLMRKAETARLDHKSLISLSYQYHQEVCADQSCVIYEKQMPSVLVNFGPLIGSQMVWLKSGENAYPNDRRYLNGNFYTSTPSAIIGIFARINLPNVDERVHLQYEASYQNWSATALNSRYSDIYNSDIRNEVTFDNQLFSNSIMLRFHFPSSRLRPVIALGGFVDYIISNDFYRDRSVYQYDDGVLLPVGRIELLDPYQQFNYGFAVSSGLLCQTANKREVHLDLKYQFSPNYYISMTSHQVLLTLGYSLIKMK
ncbi:hypothetical protein [Reichenbachiella ulvae]|uniref:Outer membrane protein beta-barrel domain-containing protein n=1 Tax=Reichenbachiella ulvae TaxID=2980104 RepID=A0ABT3CWZ3_9BACT|nr:hypothetical protein [Reichenbachiella ulvae]MCV9388059.1 hypothetical protein [Reichenbachiella ulvae]